MSQQQQQQPQLTHHGMHAAWLLLHALGLWQMYVLPTDLARARATARSAGSGGGPFGSAYGGPAGVACLAAVAMNLATFYALRQSDPGFLRPSLLPSADSGVVAAAEGGCRVCLVAGGPLAKHCKFCGRCVGRWDHHCSWTGICVGAANHDRFVRYLATQVAVLAIGFHLTLTAVNRHSGAWPLLLLGAFALGCIVVGGLLVVHTLLVVLNKTSRQVMRKQRLHAAPPGACLPAEQQLSLGLCLQGIAFIACGVRPAWLLTNACISRTGTTLSRMGDNEYCSCC